ncbi:MAG TPA: sigma-70 family RNA polymerase sigma factor, partial [Kofleriaceae bacterium]|nr:sigma-70 family RNA polymerase sigma factor [Kofleriaceae bacterium]
MGQAVTDAELIAASRRGEREAFGHLVERYLALVCAVSYSTTRNQALSEDVAQDTFLAAWAQLDQLRETSRLRSWLCGIARNLARKARARGVREAPHEQGTVEQTASPMWPPSTSTPFEAVSRAETERVVWDALGRIPAAYREVLVLYYQQQRSIGEVAAALGISEEAALQRLTRGRRQLAGEVTGAIEATLERSRPRGGLVSSVMAALPPFAPRAGGAAVAGSVAGASAAASAGSAAAASSVSAATAASSAAASSAAASVSSATAASSAAAASSATSSSSSAAAASSTVPPAPAPAPASTAWPHVATSQPSGARMLKLSLFSKVALAVAVGGGLAGAV